MELNEATKEKLSKVLALMDSPIPGERAAASETANRIIKENGITWRDAFGLKRQTRTRSAEKIDPPENWRQTLEYCVLRVGQMTKRDCKLIKNLYRYKGRPYQAQVERVEHIRNRLMEEEYAVLTGGANA